MSNYIKLLASVYPNKHAGNLTAEEAEWIKNKYNRWQIMDLLLVLIIWPIVTTAVAYLLYHTYLAYHAVAHKGSSMFLCGMFVFFTSSFIFSGGLLYYPITWAQRLLLGRWYNAYTYNYEQVNGYDLKKASKGVSKTLVIIGAIPLWGIFPLATIVNNNSIQNNYPFGFSKDIVEVNNIATITRYKTTQDRSGKVHHTPVYLVTLKTGEDINTGGWVASFGEIDSAINMLRRFHTLTIDSAELLYD